MSEEEKYFFSDFKEIRESKNITIEDIVKNTRIQEQYIYAIEKGNFQDLPLVYTRLFLKSYCKVMGLDIHKILKQYTDYMKGNKTTTKTNNRTPKFIENKNKMNNRNSTIDNISSNNSSSYFIQPQKLLSFIFTLLLIVVVWITIAKISENNSKKEIIFDNTKLNWKYLDELSLIDSETLKVNKGTQKNIIKYETLENAKNKILITNDKYLDLENKILNKNDQGEKEFNTNIKFGILNGNINLSINGQVIDFRYNDKIIIGDLKINSDGLEITLTYFE